MCIQMCMFMVSLQTVDGLSKTTYEAAMAHVVSVRQQRQREYAKYCKMQKDLIQNLDRRVKERTTQPVSKTKQSGQGQHSAFWVYVWEVSFKMWTSLIYYLHIFQDWKK